MIKVELNNVKVCGSAAVLSAELSLLIHSMREQIGEDFVKRAIASGMKSEEEIKAENRAMSAELEKILGVSVDKMVEEIKNAILKKEGK